MFPALDALFHIISVLVNTIGVFIMRIVQIIQLIYRGFESIGLVYAFLPDVVKAFIPVIIAYSVIINVLNRGG